MPHRDFAEYNFHEHYRARYGGSGQTYNYYEPAYLFGYDLAHDKRYRNRDWTVLEGDARRDWERRYTNSLWEDFKDAVREGWQQVKRSLDTP